MARTPPKESMMRNTNGWIDPLPEDFRSDEEAADFWDRHSITDYEEFLDPAELEADLQRRLFEIEGDGENLYIRVR
jgi:hypothetical protein